MQQPSSGQPVASALDAVPRVSSATLMQGGTLVEIEHAGQRYQLRVTRENKLILTK